jgi:hypothetical protein
MLNLKESCHQLGYKLSTSFPDHHSMVQLARNEIAHYFLNHSTATHLFFIDGDQAFRPIDVFRMLHANVPFIIGPVPKKNYLWPEIQKSVQKDDPKFYLHGVDFNINYLDDHYFIDEDTPFQIRHGGTAFMCIRRDVFTDLMAHTPTYTGKVRDKYVDIYNFFQVQINNETKHILSEDYFFCESYRRIGGGIWCAPWCNVIHFGPHGFRGDYASRAAIEKEIKDKLYEESIVTP